MRPPAHFPFITQVPGITGPPPAAPPVLGLTMVPAKGGMPREMGLGAADTHGAAKIMEMAAALAEAERLREKQLSTDARRDEEMRQVGGAWGGLPLFCSKALVGVESLGAEGSGQDVNKRS